jgi:hypothetical protein
MGDFEFDIDLLISLVEAGVVGQDGDICKDRNEMKKAWREVGICLQGGFKALGDDKKNAFVEYCHNFLNTVD